MASERRVVWLVVVDRGGRWLDGTEMGGKRVRLCVVRLTTRHDLPSSKERTSATVGVVSELMGV